MRPCDHTVQQYRAHYHCPQWSTLRELSHHRDDVVISEMLHDIDLGQMRIQTRGGQKHACRPRRFCAFVNAWLP